MNEVAARSYDGDFIQFQGDRIQVLYYEAPDFAALRLQGH